MLPEEQKTPGEPSPSVGDYAPLRVESAWGAAAAFCLWQAFGSVVANAFIFFWSHDFRFGPERDPLAILNRLWGLVWIIIFLSVENNFIGEMRRFFSARGLGAFAALSSPLEWFKLAFTLPSAAAWLICFTAYPFPASAAGPHRLLSLTFLVGAFLLALANNRANKKYAGKMAARRDDSIAELVVTWIFVGGVCGTFIAVGYVIPLSLRPASEWASGGGEAFYIFSLLGIGFLLLYATPILLRGTLLTRDLPHCGPLGAVADCPPP